MTRCLIALVALLLPSLPILAQEAEDASPDVAERIHAYLKPYADAGHLSGTVLLAKGNEVLFERSYGMASYELGVPNAPSTRFSIASVTKPMTIAVFAA